jgi:phosphotransferase system HPr-like phosphotransfer protein
MITLKVNLNSIDKVKSFVNTATQHAEDMDLISGRYIIDAKSIMGVFAMDLSKPIEFRIHSNNQSIADAFKDYLA